MARNARRTVLLALLAAVFTVGLTFATVELPRLVDGLLQRHVTTPGGDSHADEVARLKTELFIAHTHLRTIGYACFGLTMGLIVAGFTTRRSGLAAAGAAALMLPVFAQFASVMFFLAGLGVLNAVWLPLLDLSFEIARLGMVIRAPFVLAMWVLARVGIHGYWPITLACLALGGLVFFLGTFSWLEARERSSPIATGFVYRLSRHPQYLGWILWSYGVYLLLLQGRYPRRSWGLDASLPWLASTLVIVAVALLEELAMERRAGDAYERYRASAPFLLPAPRLLGRMALLPQRLLFGSWRPERRREVAVLVGTWMLLLMTASALTYGGLSKAVIWITPEASREARLDDLVERIRNEPDGRARRRLVALLAERGEPATGHLVGLLGDADESLRNEAASQLVHHPDARAIPALVEALGDPSSGVRWNAVRALAASGSAAVTDPLAVRLEDPDAAVCRAAVAALASLGDRRALSAAATLCDALDWWDRIAGLDALGTLGDAGAVAVAIRCLEDEHPEVRRAAVIALLRLGSATAVPALERATADSDWETRLYAAETLKRLR